MRGPIYFCRPENLARPGCSIIRIGDDAVYVHLFRSSPCARFREAAGALCASPCAVFFAAWPFHLELKGHAPIPVARSGALRGRATRSEHPRLGRGMLQAGGCRSAFGCQQSSFDEPERARQGSHCRRSQNVRILQYRNGTYSYGQACKETSSSLSRARGRGFSLWTKIRCQHRFPSGSIAGLLLAVAESRLEVPAAVENTFDKDGGVRYDERDGHASLESGHA